MACSSVLTGDVIMGLARTLILTISNNPLTYHIPFPNPTLIAGDGGQHGEQGVRLSRGLPGTDA